VVHVEVFLGLVVDVYFELGDFVLCFGCDDEVVGGVDFEVFALVVFFLEERPVNYMDVRRCSAGHTSFRVI
jgi:hypothetical protein